MGVCIFKIMHHLDRLEKLSVRLSTLSENVISLQQFSTSANRCEKFSAPLAHRILSPHSFAGTHSFSAFLLEGIIFLSNQWSTLEDQVNIDNMNLLSLSMLRAHKCRLFPLPKVGVGARKCAIIHSLKLEFRPRSEIHSRKSFSLLSFHLCYFSIISACRLLHARNSSAL